MADYKNIKLITNSYQEFFTCDKEKIDTTVAKIYPFFYAAARYETLEKPSTYFSTFASQGLTHIGNYTLITSYDALFDKSSTLDIIDNDGKYKTLLLGEDKHVGGIGYHEKSGKIYISTEKNIEIYSVEEIAKAKHGEKIKPDKTISVGSYLGGTNKEGKYCLGNASYCNVINDNLYVGSFWDESANAPLIKFNLDESGNLMSAKIDNENKKIVNAVTTFRVPSAKVQGMEIYNQNGKDYYFFSCSGGQTNDSELIVATLNNKNKFDIKLSIKMPVLSEGISKNKNGDFAIIFESNSAYFPFAKNKSNDVFYLNPEAILNLIKVKDQIDELEKTKKEKLNTLTENLNSEKYKESGIKQISEDMKKITEEIKEEEEKIKKNFSSISLESKTGKDFDLEF